MRFTGLLLCCCLLSPWAGADMSQAQAEIDAENLPAAQAILERHLQHNQEDRAAQFLLARVFAWQGESSRALPLLDGLLRDEPDNVDYLLARGQALLWAGEPEAAIAPLQRAAELAPDYVLIQDVMHQARTSLTSPVSTPLPAAAAPAQRRQELELSARQDWLDSGFDDWRALRLDFASSQPEGLGWYGSVLREQRFGQWDEGAELGAVLSLDENWTLQPEVGLAPSPFFLPDWYADLRLQRRLPRGFLGAASVRRTEYETATVDRLGLTLERYWNAWRLGYTLNITDVSNAGTPVGHDLALDHYYSGLNYAGLRLTVGNEEAVEGQQLITSSVKALSLQGRHWVSPRWAVSWEAGYHQQGGYYDRRWLQLGLRHAF